VSENTRPSVLVVEDNPTAQKLFRIALETAGYQVFTADDGRSAIAQVTSRCPDLVLQDMILPDIEGLSLLRLLRALPGGRTRTVIAISGFKTLLDRAQGEPHGFDATLTKPVAPSRLVELVRSYVPLPARAEDHFGAGQLVLVVDDDPIALKLMRLRLEHVGFEVSVASDAAAALEQAQSRTPAVVLCDVLMPGTDGYEFCQTFRSVAALKHVPVVLVSAFYDGPKDQELARSVGASALVMRTPELEGVFQAMRDALARPLSCRTEPQLPAEEHLDRVMAQLQRQAKTSAEFAERSELQASQLSMLAGIAEALLRSQDVEGAFSDILAACLDSGGISRGALYRLGPERELVLTQALGFPEAALEELQRAFGCSAQVAAASPGVVVPARAGLSEGEAAAIFARAGLRAAVFVPFLDGNRCIGSLLLGTSVAEISDHDLTAFARAVGAHICQALSLSESFSRLRDAAEAGRVLSASLDREETLAALARLATARLADICEIELGSDEPRVYTSGRLLDPSLATRIRELRAACPRFHASASGAGVAPARSELIAEITDERLQQLARNAEQLELSRGLGLKSEIVVPLVARGRVLGLVSFVRTRAGQAFTERDQLAAEDLASRAAIAIDNASLYQLAQEASRAKDEFLATISHELRTPLTAILGWARMLMGGLPTAKRELAYRVIERNANAQTQLIEDLLDTSRIISGQMRLDLQPLELDRVIDRALESLKPALEHKRIAVVRSPPSKGLRIQADPGRLQQVIWNLLSNSVKFTPAGGHIEILVAPRGTHVVLTVTDDGQGIDPAFLDFVFERFKQSEGAITRAQGGLGIGLAISRHLVELHGGTIAAHSGGKGRGACFTVELPIGEVRAEPAAELKPEKKRSDPFHFRVSAELSNVDVLVVDDDADTRELLLEALEGCGARARGAASAAEAFAAVSVARPDVLLSDIGMPGEDGYALMRRIRNLPPARGGTIPAAAITAYARSEDRSLALDAGFQLHLTKPIDPSALIEAVVSLTRMGSSVRSQG
jgi:CheY-like chemotaxis protein/nitrogen-specific signal transduction histidine kinase